MNFKDKKIGIWGFGIVGKAALEYFKSSPNLSVLDQKTLPEPDQQMLQSKNISVLTQENLHDFLDTNDFILPSPGIDLRAYKAYNHKWLAELDLFTAAFKKPIVAITGSIGKTTVTHLLSAIINHHKIPTATGGNIGIGMLELLKTAHDKQMAILELSSFQLELTTTFAPDLAIWTTFYPNHLDRHGSIDEYFNAKLKILTKQTNNQTALLPLSLAPKIFAHCTPTSKLAFFSIIPPTQEQRVLLRPHDDLYFISNECIVKETQHAQKNLLALHELPEISFLENWLIICAALDILQVPITNLHAAVNQTELPEHRLEKVATVNNIDYYNDSKSTTAQATLAAVERLHNKPVILFLGGISKGVDRTPLVQQLHGKVKTIYCFGKEADQLYAMCVASHIDAATFETLQEAFAHAAQTATAGDCILLSPAGASFDLFANFQERGTVFKSLVRQLNQS